MVPFGELSVEVAAVHTIYNTEILTQLGLPVEPVLEDTILMGCTLASEKKTANTAQFSCHPKLQCTQAQISTRSNTWINCMNRL